MGAALQTFPTLEGNPCVESISPTPREKVSSQQSTEAADAPGRGRRSTTAEQPRCQSPLTGAPGGGVNNDGPGVQSQANMLL